MKAKPVVIDGNIVTKPLSDPAQRAVSEVFRKHVEEINAALEPFGLDAMDVLVPVYERVVREGEVDPLGADPESHVTEEADRG